MNKKLLYIVAILSFAAALGIYIVGSTNAHLIVLKDFFWVPIPLGLIALVAAKKKDDEG